MSILTDILGTVMGWCYTLVKNYGFAIILFTFFSKIVLLPVTVWVQKNSIIMVKMMPFLNKIKIEHFGDKDTIADETQKLYKENKYHPTATVIPVAIQILLLIGVIGVIYRPMDYVLTTPADLKESFTEITLENNPDLDPESNSLQMSVVEAVQADNTAYISASDGADKAVEEINALNLSFAGFNLSLIPIRAGGFALLIPLIAGFSAWLLSYAQNRMNVLQSAQGAINKYGTMAFSVGISLFLGAFVPAGVALYWIASNLFTILQQYLLNLAINPKKYVDFALLDETREELSVLEANSKRNKLKRNDPIRIKEREDYKRFFTIGNKHLVFYSESNGFYKYYADTIEYILDNTDIPLHYITSDPKDHIFEMAKENPQIIPYYIGNEKLITLMMKIDADVVVMTMPDLETYQIKRSYVRKDIEYVYIPHCMNSLNLTMRKGCTDHFDSVLCTGIHQKEEIEKTEEVYGLPHKELIEAGYPLLDTMIRQYQESQKDRVPPEKKTVLIAPSWQKGNIVDSCLDEILDQIKGHDYQVIVRPHPQHVRLMPDRIDSLKARFEDDPSVEIQTDFTSNNTVFDADMIITDWSGIGYEYAITTRKPVLFINTPMKIMNPEYEKIGIEPFNIYMRDILGAALDLDKIDQTAEKVDYLLTHAEEYKDIIQDVIDKYCYAIGRSGEVSAKYIIEVVFRQIAKRKANAA